MKILERHRDKMIETLVSRGIRDQRVLDALRQVPRHKFVPAPLLRDTYRDAPLPIGHGQTISQPYIVARMTELLQVQKGDKILEVGTGSGYQAAVLAHLGAWVFTVERHKGLWTRANSLFKELNLDRIITHLGDGSVGWSSAGPFDGIIVTAAGPEIPQILLNQLKTGGRMVIPTGGRETQSLIHILRDEQDHFVKREIASVAFVPLIGKGGWDK